MNFAPCNIYLLREAGRMDATFKFKFLSLLELVKTPSYKSLLIGLY